ncbi:MAG: DCC1-like thiol-disulfide oxidoreductase family protein [Paracoccus sp. (in: a-proteobacteria)]|uniref:DCC1-like thiol-disulfide oxidoreductase family protein n=1 Tax=Paracoccus sp. TaxID=267 RepID=UPI0026DEE591|nr:DCC1-like thiol-disulfide oxidoreductase family protein [Paracoccus sp. (in: a-proteobacteria)]MDO5632170.1 DCC1-like thiol-disulfide oxidoreductase family protein [Paracoccus sp. (in: a-proteobacteria)]
MTQKTALIEIVYDGECPFCTDFTRVVALRRLGEVALIDARGTDPRVTEIGAGLDLNQGMAVRHNGRVLFGADAMALLLALSPPRGPWKVLPWFFATPRRAWLAYPVLRAGRNIVLRLLGRRQIEGQ